MTGSSTPVRWRRRALDARPGEPLLKALARMGLPILGRSIRYHRPRAPFCGVGACTQCLVRVNGEPNVRACRYVPAPGDSVEAENAWPTPRHDLFGLLDVLFFRGFDSHRGFIRPRFASRFYQRTVRRFAGYGRLADPAPDRPHVGEHLVTDVAIVGGGASGCAAAKRLVAAGRRVVLLDRGPTVPVPSGVDLRDWTTVSFLPPPLEGRSTPFHLVAVREPSSGIDVRATEVVVATGAYDAGLLFDGNDRPGVMTAEGAEAVSSPGLRPPFAHAVVFGGGARAAEVLDRFGEHVEAVAAPGAIAPPVTERAARLEIPLYPRSLLLSAVGRGKVRRVDLAPRGGEPPFSVPADAVILAHRRLPNPQLFFQAGARMEWRGGTGAYYPVLDGATRTSVPGLHAVGAAAGFLPEAAPSSGEAAARELLGESGLPDPGPRVDRDRPHELVGYFREALPRLRRAHRAFLCPCEDILLSGLEEANRLGYQNLQVVKRFSDVGTGLCQGRYCLPDAILLLSILENTPPEELGYITQRPPVLPAPLSALADLGEPAPGATP